MFSAEANRVKTAPKQRKREILSELFEQSTPFTAKDFLLMPPRMEVTYEEFIIVNRYNSFFNLLKQSKLHYFYACEKLTKNTYQIPVYNCSRGTGEFAIRCRLRETKQKNRNCARFVKRSTKILYAAFFTSFFKICASFHISFCF